MGTRTTLALAAALASALAATPALAQDTSTPPPVAEFEDAAWKAMNADLATVMPRAEIAGLKLIAWHAVAEMLCDRVAMDMDKVTKATAALHPTNWEELTAEDHKTWEHNLLVNYGMIVGVMLAEHAENPAPVCAEANELMADSASDWHYFAASE